MLFSREAKQVLAPEISAEMPVSGNAVTIGVHADFTDMKDTAAFYYAEGNREVPDEKSDCIAGIHPFGPEAKLKFRLDHFTGVRFALFIYSTEQTGGYAEFSDFVRC